MKKETYTSPFTGKTYTAFGLTLWRQGWDADGAPEKIWYTEYNWSWCDGGTVLTTFSTDENTLHATFGEYEGVYAPWSTSRYD